MRTVLTATAMATALTLGSAPPVVHAQPAPKAVVDAAKASGAAGEQADGFVGLVGGGRDPTLSTAVAEINAGRMRAYREAAVRTGATPEAAGQATARQLEARLPSGQYFRTTDGRWERR